MNKVPKWYGKKLRQFRLKAGLTQRDVSRSLNYSTAQFVSNWERGVSTPPPKDFGRLSEILQVRPRDLIDMFYRVRLESAYLERKKMIARLKADRYMAISARSVKRRGRSIGQTRRTSSRRAA